MYKQYLHTHTDIYIHVHLCIGFNLHIYICSRLPYIPVVYPDRVRHQLTHLDAQLYLLV